MLEDKELGFTRALETNFDIDLTFYPWPFQVVSYLLSYVKKFYQSPIFVIN